MLDVATGCESAEYTAPIADRHVHNSQLLGGKTANYNANRGFRGLVLYLVLDSEHDYAQCAECRWLMFL